MSTGSTRAFRSRSTETNTFYPRVFGRRGAVAAEHYSAALAGIEMLRLGGNAVDAACAAALVEGVVNPQMHTIGGELPILISAPGQRRGLHQWQHGGAGTGHAAGLPRSGP